MITTKIRNYIDSLNNISEINIDLIQNSTDNIDSNDIVVMDDTISDESIFLAKYYITEDLSDTPKYILVLGDSIENVWERAVDYLLGIEYAVYKIDFVNEWCKISTILKYKNNYLYEYFEDTIDSFYRFIADNNYNDKIEFIYKNQTKITVNRNKNFVRFNKNSLMGEKFV